MTILEHFTLFSLFFVTVSGQLDLPSLFDTIPTTPPPQTEVPPSPPSPVLTGASDILDVPADIIFDNNNKKQPQPLDNTASAFGINLDFFKETADVGAGAPGDPNIPRKTDLSSLLDLISTDPTALPKPEKASEIQPPDFFSPPSKPSTEAPPQSPSQSSLPDLSALPDLTSILDSNEPAPVTGIPVVPQPTADQLAKQTTPHDSQSPSLDTQPETRPEADPAQTVNIPPRSSQTGNGRPALSDNQLRDLIPPRFRRPTGQVIPPIFQQPPRQQNNAVNNIPPGPDVLPPQQNNALNNLPPGSDNSRPRPLPRDILPYAENVLNQVQELVTHLREQSGGRSSSRPDTSSGDRCPRGSPRCFENPCERSSCLNILNAQCRRSCSCQPRFYLFGRDVTDACVIVSNLRPGLDLRDTSRRANMIIGPNGEFVNIPSARRQSPRQGGVPPPRRDPRRPVLIDPRTNEPIDPRFLQRVDPRLFGGPFESRRLPPVDPRVIEAINARARETRPPVNTATQARPAPASESTRLGPQFVEALLREENQAIRDLRARFQARRQNGRRWTPFATPPITSPRGAAINRRIFDPRTVDVDALNRFIAEQGLGRRLQNGRRDSIQNTRGDQRTVLRNQARNGLTGGLPTVLPNAVASNRPTEQPGADAFRTLTEQFQAFRRERGGNIPSARNPGAPQNPLPNNSNRIAAAMRQFQRQASGNTAFPSRRIRAV